MTTENDGATLVRQIVTRSPVFVLLKGDVEKPFCRFSKQLVHLLLSFGISFHGFNVLSVREQHLYREFKEYAQFPTFPQLYVAGALVGGLDICQELLETGELLAVRFLSWSHSGHTLVTTRSWRRGPRRVGTRYRWWQWWNMGSRRTNSQMYMLTLKTLGATLTYACVCVCSDAVGGNGGKNCDNGNGTSNDDGTVLLGYQCACGCQ